jgi:hypothetical protein
MIVCVCVCLIMQKEAAGAVLIYSGGLYVYMYAQDL